MKTAMTESRVFVGIAVLLFIFGFAYAVTRQWLGVVGSLLGSAQGLAVRWFLLKWKPKATNR